MFQNVSIQNKFDSEKAGLQKITVLDKNIISDWHGGGGGGLHMMFILFLVRPFWVLIWNCWHRKH